MYAAINASCREVRSRPAAAIPRLAGPLTLHAQVVGALRQPLRNLGFRLQRRLRACDIQTGAV